MTEKCKKAREEIDNLFRQYISDKTNENWEKYSMATHDFTRRFHKRYDPQCYIDECVFYNDFAWVNELLQSN